MAKGIYVVYTDVDDDRVDEFNAWYDEIHIPDLLRVGCITGAERFMLRGAGQELRLKTGDLGVPKFLTIYHVDILDEIEIKAQLAQARPSWIRQGRLFDRFKVGISTLYEEILPLQRPQFGLN